MDATGWWLVGAAVIAGFVAGSLWSWLRQRRGRTAEETAERAEIRALWRLTKRVPTRKLLRDNDTGLYLGVDRHHSLLEIVVSDFDFTDPASDRIPDAVITSYHLGSAWRPLPPPIMRMHVPLNARTSRTWREAGELLDFNDQTGAMNTTGAELAALHSQLDRALRA